MALVRRPDEKLSQAFELLNDPSNNAVQEFLLARESQTTESILGGEDQTTYSFGTFLEEEEELLDELRERATEVVQNQFEATIKNENKELVEYDISNRNKSDSLLEYVDADNIQNFDRFDGLLDTTSVGKFRLRPEQDPAFQAFRIVEDGEVRFAAIQKFTQRQVISDEGGVKIAFDEDNEKYNSFKGTVVSLLDRIDCFYFDGSIYILSTTRFEDIFDYLHEYKDDANDVLNTIEDSDINISDFDRFVDSVRNDRRALRKMREIKEVGVYKDLTRNEVEQVVDDFGLAIDVEEGDEDEEWAIAIPDLRKKWDVIRLLNDDHLYSDLSKDRYQVYGKENRS